MPQRATDERSRWPESVFTFPESVFNLPGMRVHLRPESVFKIVRNTHKPHGASADDPVPGLVLVHGGPGGQTRTGYRAMVQHLVNHGYAVLGANNRGSSGYGKTFFHLDDKRHGEEDLQDIVYGRRYLESLDWIDGDRIGIIGASYGSYMVAAALAFEPEAFDVGIDIFGVTNWVRTLDSIPPWWEATKESLYDEIGDPATDAARLRRISPLFHTENIVKPTLVIQGANDPRVLQIESDELVAGFRQMMCRLSTSFSRMKDTASARRQTRFRPQMPTFSFWIPS